MPHHRSDAIPRLVTIIVNYRAGSLLMDGLERLVTQHKQLPESQIIIVDNFSDNGDAQALQDFVMDKNLADYITIIAHPKNDGFGAGNNVALRQLLRTSDKAEAPDYIFLLNPDATLTDDCLPKLYSFMEAHPEAGFAGCAIDDMHAIPQTSAFRFFSPLGEFESTIRTGVFSKLLNRSIVALPPSDSTEDAPKQVDWVSGAAHLIRTKTLKDIGEFDEGYFLYFEETDMQFRAKKAGWQVWHVPAARAQHQEGYSTGATGGMNDAKPISEHYFRSRNYYFRKNHGIFGRILADIGWLAGATGYWIRCVLTRKPTAEAGGRIVQFLNHLGKSQRLR